MVLAYKAHIQQPMGIHEACSTWGANADHRKPQYGDPCASGRYVAERRDACGLSHFGFDRLIRNDDTIWSVLGNCLTSRQLIGS